MTIDESKVTEDQMNKLYSFYQGDEKKYDVKEYFKFVGKHLSDKFENSDKLDKKVSLLDVGCAAGDFLIYLNTENEFFELFGMDILPASVEIAKEQCPDAEFITGNVAELDTLPSQNFDVVTMLGVNQVFDDFRDYFKGLFKLARTNGLIYIFGIYNPEPVDAILRVRRSGDVDWERGWNYFSKETISTWLEEQGKTFRFYDWKISIDLEKNPKDPIRSYTKKDSEGNRYITNGIQLIQNFSLIEIVNI